MAKNRTIGHIDCPLCKSPGEVRRYKDSARGQLYWACRCGQIRPATNQTYIKTHALFYQDAADLAPPGVKFYAPPPPPPAAPVTPPPPAAPVAHKSDAAPAATIKPKSTLGFF